MVSGLFQTKDDFIDFPLHRGKIKHK